MKFCGNIFKYKYLLGSAQAYGYWGWGAIEMRFHRADYFDPGSGEVLLPLIWYSHFFPLCGNCEWWQKDGLEQWLSCRLFRKMKPLFSKHNEILLQLSKQVEIHTIKRAFERIIHSGVRGRLFFLGCRSNRALNI